LIEICGTYSDVSGGQCNDDDDEIANVKQKVKVQGHMINIRASNGQRRELKTWLIC